jgi:cobalt-zinc-cadmium efflux system membrane fusion protein
MNRILKVLNLLALIAVAFFLGRAILHTEKKKPAGVEEAHGEEGGAGHDAVAITPEKAESARIGTAETGPASLQRSRKLFGQFRANEESVGRVTPRFAGVVHEVEKRLGDTVEKGETLVAIESNESLQPYTVKALISGTVIFRDVAVGEAVTEGQRLMTIADLSTLWVDLNAYPEDYSLLKIGQPVEITATALEQPVTAQIDYISPFGTEGTQTMLARATIQNTDRHLRPGLFAEGKILIGKEDVPLAVENAALQTWEEKNVIFVRDEHGFKAAPVELGRSDDSHTEILSGIEAGAVYATENSFLLKAELGKSMAEEH